MSAQPPPAEAPPAEPALRLPASAKWLWRIQGGAAALAALIGFGYLGALAGGVWPAIALSVSGLWLLLAVTVVPELRHRRWRYEVREQEIDIRRGTFAVTRTIVPMRRVQHVATTRGVLEQALELSTVVFNTAAGSTSIPALGMDEADRVRTRIATLARTADEL